MLESLAPPFNVTLHLPSGHTLGALVVNSGIFHFACIISSLHLHFNLHLHPSQSSSHQSHVERSHTSTNKSSSSQTACNRQTLGWDTSRLECGSSSIHCRLLARVGHCRGQWCIFRLFVEIFVRFRICIINQRLKFKLCELFILLLFTSASLLFIVYLINRSSNSVSSFLKFNYIIINCQYSHI